MEHKRILKKTLLICGATLMILSVGSISGTAYNASNNNPIAQVQVSAKRRHRVHHYRHHRRISHRRISHKFSKLHRILYGRQIKRHHKIRRHRRHSHSRWLKHMRKHGYRRWLKHLRI